MTCHSAALINTYNEMGSREYEDGADLKMLSLLA